MYGSMDKLTWDVTEKIEVLREFTSEVLASYENYLLTNKISLSDTGNIAVKMYLSLSHENNKLLACNTLDAVSVIEGKFLLGKDFLEWFSGG